MKLVKHLFKQIILYNCLIFRKLNSFKRMIYKNRSLTIYTRSSTLSPHLGSRSLASPQSLKHQIHNARTDHRHMSLGSSQIPSASQSLCVSPNYYCRLAARTCDMRCGARNSVELLFTRLLVRLYPTTTTILIIHLVLCITLGELRRFVGHIVYSPPVCCWFLCDFPRLQKRIKTHRKYVHIVASVYPS